MKTIKLAAALMSMSVLAGCAGGAASKPVASKAIYLDAEKASAQEVAPTTKPAQSALPAGHPQISTAKGQLPAGHPQIPAAGEQKQLPAGHPQIPAGGEQQQLPAGHPQMPADAGGDKQPMQLPAGHPTMEQMQAAATTQPAFIGTLTVKAVQKTAGGTAVANDSVTVEVYDQENMIKKIDAKLDETGLAKVNDIPFGGSYGQFVRVNHGGVEYTAQPDAPAPKATSAEVAVNVFEATEEAPAWQLKMRHMILQPVDGGVQVTDVLAVENPSDKAWLGKAEGDGKRTTFAVDLPAGATNVSYDGNFHDCCVKFENGKVVNSMPITPGVNKYQISYMLPVAKGKAVEVATSAPALTKNMIVMVPDDGSAVSAVGLEGPSTVNMGGGNTRFFRGQEIKTGTALKITLTSPTVNHIKSAGTSSSVGSNASQIGRLVAGAGGLLIFLIGGTVMFIKAPKSGKRSK